ncbi:Erythroid differentiation-related factor 1 [Phytophthora cinnamomi]|uniref:Erythroid differentiation-related factor 1 n=1 Tax=Phytophthora cinnamomi TaxID=4785 RepID=UPI002A2B8D6A|nr:Erythroid differentiation-related factor 1 [Phytophthora cinnamomi]KAJ8552344.1 hypothetical protein ON010_g10202 [Phytophthora cinnamomi]
MAKKKQQKQQGESRARGPNWTTTEILKLIEAWRVELDTPAEKGESTALLNRRVFEQFKTLCGGTTSRSEKAVIDKKNNLPIAYKLIVAVNNNRVVGSTGQPCWFELSREQKKAIKAADKTDARNADMDIAVFNALKNILGGDDSVEPSALVSSTPIFEREDSSAPRQTYFADFADNNQNTDAAQSSCSGGDNPLVQALPLSKYCTASSVSSLSSPPLDDA